MTAPLVFANAHPGWHERKRRALTFSSVDTRQRVTVSMSMIDGATEPLSFELTKMEALQVASYLLNEVVRIESLEAEMIRKRLEKEKVK